MLIKQQLRRVRLAVVALALVGAAPSAFADLGDTNFDTNIVNRASVNYSVSGVPQTVIRSSPLGNSTPGAAGGADTDFEVDKKIMFVAEETDGAATVSLRWLLPFLRVTGAAPGELSLPTQEGVAPAELADPLTRVRHAAFIGLVQQLE